MGEYDGTNGPQVPSVGAYLLPEVVVQSVELVDFRLLALLALVLLVAQLSKTLAKDAP